MKKRRERFWEYHGSEDTIRVVQGLEFSLAQPTVEAS